MNNTEVSSDIFDWDGWADPKGTESPDPATFRCGHTQPLPDHISRAAAPLYRIWTLANRDCLPCYLDKMASDAAVEGRYNGLPALLGTYPQVRWALTVRRARAAEVDAARAAAPLSARTEMAVDRRLAVTDAGWWIDSRDIPLGRFAAKRLPAR